MVIAILPVKVNAEFVIDDFEQGGPFSLTANQANPFATSIANLINVPGGVRQVSLFAPDQPDKYVNATLTDTTGDDSLFLTGMNPPNKGFYAADIRYGIAIAGHPSLQLDLTPFGDRLYIDLIEGDIPSGYLLYPVLFSAGAGAFGPAFPGTESYLAPDGRGRYEIPFAYFTDNAAGALFDPSDIDGVWIEIISSEVREGGLPLAISKIGVIPESTSGLAIGLGLAALVLHQSALRSRRPVLQLPKE